MTVAVEPGRGAGLQPPELQAERLEPRRQAEHRLLAEPAGRDGLFAAMDQAAEERAGGQDDGLGREAAAVEQDDACNPAVLDDQVVDFALDDLEVRLRRDRGLHRLPVELAVGLRAGPAHGRPLAAVEDAELDAGGIGDAAHQAVQRVDLAHQVALAEPADRRDCSSSRRWSRTCG